jgi:hypothetical protein
MFRITLTLSAFLLFLVQPLIGRVLLPKVGGSAATWTVCMLFFQLALLAGYAYAHLSATRLRQAIGVRVHLLLLTVGGVLLFTSAFSDARPPDGVSDIGAIAWLLGYLVTTCGAPFVLVAAHAPLLQRWFSQTTDAEARDPYFLYAASNAGSFAALLSYPFAVEPLLTLGEQQRFWQGGYWLLAGCVAICGLIASRHTAPRPTPSASDEVADPSPTGAERARWVLLAAVPSSLVLGLTTYISTELAPVPLFWVAPLAIYLATFVVAFSKRATTSSPWPARLLPIVALPVAMSALRLPPRALWLSIPCHLGFLALAALVCHTRLARERPAASRLTEFYLWISVGGAIGGLWNGLVAPLVFNNVYEYPVAIALACLLRPSAVEHSLTRRSWMNVVVPISIFAAIIGTAHTVDALGVQWHSSAFMAVVFGPSLLALMLLWPRAVTFGLGITALLAGTIMVTDMPGEVRVERRTFFGRLRVVDDTSGLRQLIHGSTLHGAQAIDPAGAREPISYYHRNSPLAEAIQTSDAVRDAPVAVIGLGTGAISAYAAPGQRWDFYEIDRGVVDIATNPALFTFLSNSPGSVHVVLGDGRVSLTRVADGTYGVIVLDAFSSDAVPVHLLTRDALTMYFRKLRPDGFLLCHISNRYLRLGPVLGSAAGALGATAILREDVALSDAEAQLGKLPSIVVAMSLRSENLARLAADTRWTALAAGSRWTRWSDDYANPLAAIRWR